MNNVLVVSARTLPRDPEDSLIRIAGKLRENVVKIGFMSNGIRISGTGIDLGSGILTSAALFPEEDSRRVRNQEPFSVTRFDGVQTNAYVGHVDRLLGIALVVTGYTPYNDDMDMASDIEDGVFFVDHSVIDWTMGYAKLAQKTIGDKVTVNCSDRTNRGYMGGMLFDGNLNFVGMVVGKDSRRKHECLALSCTFLLDALSSMDRKGIMKFSA